VPGVDDRDGGAVFDQAPQFPGAPRPSGRGDGHVVAGHGLLPVFWLPHLPGHHALHPGKLGALEVPALALMPADQPVEDQEQPEDQASAGDQDQANAMPRTARVHAVIAAALMFPCRGRERPELRSSG
jgi:hypothetical protein